MDGSAFPSTFTLAITAGGIGNTLAGNVGDMSATWRNVAYFRPDRANLATWFLVCQLTFVSLFPDMYGPRTDNICT
jgi:hypothetical protein